jgi:hypothetical protein
MNEKVQFMASKTGTSGAGDMTAFLTTQFQGMTTHFQEQLVQGFNTSVRDLVKTLVTSFPSVENECKALYNQFLLIVRLDPKIPLCTVRNVMKQPDGQTILKLVEANDDKTLLQLLQKSPFVASAKLHQVVSSATDAQKALVWRHIGKLTNIAKTAESTSTMFSPDKIAAMEKIARKLGEDVKQKGQPPALEELAPQMAAELGFEWKPENTAQVAELKKQLSNILPGKMEELISLSKSAVDASGQVDPERLKQLLAAKFANL